MNASFFSSLGSFGMPAFWLIAMVVLLIVEGLAPGLVSIWFALGALAALISALLGAPVWLQIVWFLLVSIVTLALTRPLARKYVNGRIVATNADMLIGQECIVRQTINDLQGTGAVFAGGKEWTARCASPEETIEAGSVAVVEKIEGVKLIVKKK